VTWPVWLAISVVVIVAMFVRRRWRATRDTDLGTISERWLTEQRTGRDQTR
jgi:hypothetical protein